MSETTPQRLETASCPRCCGSGRYSYCQTMNGRYGPETCFKCLGSGMIYTKRGIAAKALLNRAYSVPAKDVKVGDVVRMSGDRHFRTVESVGWDDENNWSSRAHNPDGTYRYYFRIRTTACDHGLLDDTPMIRVAQTGERKAFVAPLVAEYQALLTKAGREPKTKAKAARVAEIKAAIGVPAEWTP